MTFIVRSDEDLIDLIERFGILSISSKTCAISATSNMTFQTNIYGYP